MVYAPDAYRQAYAIPILTPAQKPKRCKKQVAITAIALEIIFLSAAIGCGVAAIISGSALVWLGVIPCALLMISVVGGALCCVKPPTQRERVFSRRAFYPTETISLRALGTERESAVRVSQWA